MRQHRVYNLITMHLHFSDILSDLYTNYLVCIFIVSIYPCCLGIHLRLHIITSLYLELLVDIVILLVV